MTISKKYQWAEIWLIIYAIAIVLLPPLRAFGKSFYAAEILLTPLIMVFFKNLILKKVGRPPKELIAVGIALTCAFFVGMGRDNFATSIVKYWTFTEDHFSFSKDIIRYFRFLLILSTPWIISQTFPTEHRGNYSELFLKTLKYSLVASVCVAIVEKFGLINLRALYHPDPYAYFWEGRSYATFSSPLESGMFFMAMGIQTLSSIKSRRKLTDVIIGLVLLLGFVMSKGGTALVAGLVAVIYLAFIRLNSKNRGIVIGGLVTSCIVFILFLPQQYIAAKSGNVLYRTMAWRAWIMSLPEHPHFAAVGMGFTNMVSDNSFFLFVLIGGLLLLIPVLLWLNKLRKLIPMPCYPFFIVWVVSWLALDTIAYWGIGRAAWLLLGLFWVDYNTSNRLNMTHVQTVHSP